MRRRHGLQGSKNHVSGFAIPALYAAALTALGLTTEFPKAGAPDHCIGRDQALLLSHTQA